jgi:L-alanine-DL-glutamate epimerase-like enolase superfamily enzyme
LSKPIETHGGMARVPDTPGLGAEPDVDAIERYRCGEPVSVG